MNDTLASSALPTLHVDLITCLAFSQSSPALLASTSLDGHIRVHARVPDPSSRGQASISESKAATNGERQHDDDEPQDRDDWVEIGSCKANEGPVWKAIWAPREYGTSILVSISGSVVHIWETQLQRKPDFSLNFVLRATLIEARGSLRDVAFGPSESGMKLACISADSHLRLYECLDPSPAGLSTWSLLEDVDLAPLPLAYYSPAIAHTGSALQSTQLIKGFDDRASPRSSNIRNDGAASNPHHQGHVESSGAWALAFCQEVWWGELAAVSAGKEGFIRILSFSAKTSWAQLLVLSHPHGTPTSPISTIAWAPSCGRSHHLIAAGARDGSVRIWKLVPPIQDDAAWTATLAAEINEHMEGSSGGIGRVEWNVTGSVLSTAGCDGVVRLWKATFSGEWRNLSAISCEEQRR